MRETTRIKFCIISRHIENKNIRTEENYSICKAIDAQLLEEYLFLTQFKGMGADICAERAFLLRCGFFMTINKMKTPLLKSFVRIF